MKKSNKLTGTGTALVTPFKSDFTVDFKSLGKIIDAQLKGNIDYLVLMGTTGESVTLDKKEKADIISFAKERVKKKIPLVVGIGGNNTTEVIQMLQSQDL